jgi:DNA-binding CsgD family transcriptional regulator
VETELTFRGSPFKNHKLTDDLPLVPGKGLKVHLDAASNEAFSNALAILPGKKKSMTTENLNKIGETSGNCPYCGHGLQDAVAISENINGSLSLVRRDLSRREREVVNLVRQAKANKEIAYELSLTEGTIKEYLFTIFKKVGVKNRTELALWAALNPVSS